MRICKSVGQAKWGKGKLLRAMITKLDLCAVNAESYCIGETSTYMSTCGNSLIDYILVERALVTFVQRIDILAETPNNTAFHLPVVLHV